jgi:glutamyl-tRNA reductase
MAFIDQARRDIRKKVQRLEGLQCKSLRDLVQVPEKVYHNRETEEEKEQRIRKKEDEREMKNKKKRKATGKKLTKNLTYSS